MARIFVLISLGCMLLAFGGCAASKDTNRRVSLRDTVEKIPAEKVQFFLYSLNPNKILRDEPESSTGYFHGYFVLGETQINLALEKKDLLAALARAMREREAGSSFESRLNSIVQAACFNPRHGIRIVKGLRTNDFLICFECGKVIAFTSYGNSIAPISESQEPVFDRYLNQYRLTKAK